MTSPGPPAKTSPRRAGAHRCHSELAILRFAHVRYIVVVEKRYAHAPLSSYAPYSSPYSNYAPYSYSYSAPYRYGYSAPYLGYSAPYLGYSPYFGYTRAQRY